MPANEIRVGQLVFSRAGRDRGRPFLIWQLPGGDRVYLVDGNVRRVSKPKVKNIRHVQAVNRIDTTIGERLRNGEIVTDAEVRWAIARLLETERA